MGIETRTVGELIDMLITTNLKIWYSIEIETNESFDEITRFQAGQKVLKLNKKRHEIIGAINKQLNQDFDTDEKTY